MPGERRLFSPESTVPNREARIRFAPPISAEKLMWEFAQSPVYDQEWFRIGASPMHISRRELGNTTEYAALIDFQTNGWKFGYFTRVIAPNSNDTVSALGTMDDWLMPDRPRQRARLFGMHHGGLKGDWETFEQNRSIFLQTLALDPQILEHNKSTYYALGTYLNFNDETREEFIDGIADASAKTSLQTAFIDYLKTGHRFQRTKWLHKSVSNAPILEHVKKWDEWVKRDVALHFFVETLSRGDTSAREAVIDLYNSLGNGRLEAHGVNVLLEIGQSIKGELAVKKNSEKRFEWNLTPHIPPDTNVLLPVVRWRKNARGERSWVLDFMDKSTIDSYRQVLPIPQGDFDMRRVNPVYGLAVVPYLLPQLREDWPKYQAIIHGQAVPVEKYGNGGQFMGGQAGLVVALQHKDEFFQTDFFPAVEDYADRLAA